MSFHPLAPRREKSAADKDRESWEKVIQFYGDEATNEWSLRIQDKNVTKPATFVMLELWRYDRVALRWNLVDQPHVDASIVMPKDKPTETRNDDTQILYNLSEIEKGMYGLWYAKWRADGINGANFIRLGPSHGAERWRRREAAGWMGLGDRPAES